MFKLLFGILLLTGVAPAAAAGSKRGLVYIPSKTHPKDDQIWFKTAGDGVIGAPQWGSNTLTWYYSYQSLPPTSLSTMKSGSNGGLEFVPMLWGDHDNTFVEDVRKLKNQGYSIKYVLGFNEPDMSSESGGSNITPKKAAERWMKDIQPLKANGILLGAPSPAGTEEGKTWMKQFFAACTGCTIDFIPLHWYGDFQGFASHLGHYTYMYPNMTFWITELAFAHQDIGATEDMFNTTMVYLDKLSNVERYSWFGSFRSDVSNVGPNAAFLTAQGQLTNIGSWYLGGSGSGIQPAPSKARKMVGSPDVKFWWGCSVVVSVVLGCNW
ncbi:glycosyl hydrolase catalytic core-domain-containing protein [Tirmania nivea]|nr:glycosyl hydrolase catalytic core-domain-containing protein [Tirmania nivea]